MIAAAVEEYKLHRRLALAILSRAGRSPYRLVLGFLGATFFLSMWLSNTATAAMMAPLASAVMDTLSAGHGAAGGGGGQRQQEEERDARWRLLSSSLSAAGGGPQQEEDEEEEEDYEEEIDIELPTMGAGTRRPALSSAPQRSFSLDERRGPIGGGRGGVSGAGGAQEGEVGEGEEEEEEQWRRRLRTEDPGALRKREQDGEGGMVEIHLWGLPQEGTGDGAVGGADEEEEEEESADAFWCGIRKSEIEFSISVAICYGASLGGMATLTGAFLESWLCTDAL